MREQAFVVTSPEMKCLSSSHKVTSDPWLRQGRSINVTVATHSPHAKQPLKLFSWWAAG